MRWRKYPNEKPAKEYADPIWCYCCDADAPEPDFLGQLLYRPEYGMFFRMQAQVYYGKMSMIEVLIKDRITHFAFDDDIILPQKEKNENE